MAAVGDDKVEVADAVCRGALTVERTKGREEITGEGGEGHDRVTSKGRDI